MNDAPMFTKDDGTEYTVVRTHTYQLTIYLSVFLGMVLGVLVSIFAMWVFHGS